MNQPAENKYVSIGELEIGAKYNIIIMEHRKTQYSFSIVVTLSDAIRIMLTVKCFFFTENYIAFGQRNI